MNAPQLIELANLYGWLVIAQTRETLIRVLTRASSYRTLAGFSGMIPYKGLGGTFKVQTPGLNLCTLGVYPGVNLRCTLRFITSPFRTLKAKFHNLGLSQ